MEKGLLQEGLEEGEEGAEKEKKPPIAVVLGCSWSLPWSDGSTGQIVDSCQEQGLQLTPLLVPPFCLCHFVAPCGRTHSCRVVECTFRPRSLLGRAS